MIRPRVSRRLVFSLLYISTDQLIYWPLERAATKTKGRAVWRGFSSQLEVRLGTKGDPTPDVWLLADAADRNGPRGERERTALYIQTLELRTASVTDHRSK